MELADVHILCFLLYLLGLRGGVFLLGRIKGNERVRAILVSHCVLDKHCGLCNLGVKEFLL